MHLEAQPALLSNTLFLKEKSTLLCLTLRGLTRPDFFLHSQEKITLMCLTQTLFQRTGPGADRIVPFAHIATAAKLRMEEVEICP